MSDIMLIRIPSWKAPSSPNFRVRTEESNDNGKLLVLSNA
uniref:Uncharacterized protein n=1 Tax=Arundo donax TaxID=35708 RepID=A0A0A9HBA9_ARUDO